MMAPMDLGEWNRVTSQKSQGYDKPTEIIGRFEKEGLPYHFKIWQDSNGWLFGFAYGTPDGRLIMRGDGMNAANWPTALGAAIEYAKREFGFKDVLITGLTGEEYIDPDAPTVGAKDVGRRYI